MARNRETKIELTAYDDLFQTDESRAEAALSKIRDIPLSEIDEFPDHPFKVLMDEDKPVFRDERITKLIPKTVPKGQETDFVVKALEFYNRHLQRNKAHER